MEAKDILTELEAAMRQLCEIKNRLRKVAAMLTPEQKRQPDLFSDMGLTREPQRKTWKRLGVQMKDEAIVAAEKVGRKSGWCQRSDIERSLQRRNPERSREDIREAVNAAVKEMRLTCVKYNSYRFYRRSDRGLIIASALARLTA